MQWHSSGEYSSLELDVLVGTPLIMILDHFMLAHGGGRGESESTLSFQERMALICGAVSWSDAGVVEGPPLTTRLPIAVHLMVASCTCGGEMPLSCSLSIQQMPSGDGQKDAKKSKLARLTTRLGFGGLVLATAK